MGFHNLVFLLVRGSANDHLILPPSPNLCGCLYHLNSLKPERPVWCSSNMCVGDIQGEPERGGSQGRSV